MPITPLPTPPSRSTDPTNFAIEADAFVAALPAFATEANALAVDVNADEISAAASASAAAISANIASGAANYRGDYNALTTYQIGQSVSNAGRRWVAKTVNTGITPVEGANWLLINDGDVVGPVSATNNALAAFDGVTGKLIKAASLTANAVLLGNATGAPQTVAPGAVGNFLISNGTTWVSQAAGGGSITAVATGSLSNGATVVLNSDGTVSAVSKTITALNPPTSSALSNDNSTNNSTNFATAYDKKRKLVIVAWQNSTFGTNISIGQVINNSIIFSGTPYGAFATGTRTTVGLAYDDRTDQLIVAYSLTADTFGYVSIGTIFFDGPGGGRWGVAFGSPIAFDSNINIGHIALAINPDNSTVVVAYQNSNPIQVKVGTLGARTMTFGAAATVISSGDSTGICYIGNNNFAVTFRSYVATTGLNAVVVSVSGTTATVNTRVNLSGALTSQPSLCACDIAAQRLVVTYVNSTGNTGLIFVASISGTTLTAGGSTNVTSNANARVGVSFDADSGRFVFAYINSADSSRLYAVSGLITGTNIALGTAGVVNSTASTSRLPFAMFRSDVGDTIVSAFSSNIGSNVIAFVASATITTTLTTDNFIGISDASYTNGQTATIQTVGSVDDAQSGLTPGRRYFVGEDGLLKLVPGDWEPVVFAGVATTATRLLIKG